ncbi:MAG TPA: hypothetical protein VKD72_15380 [Gemmataceae bacterium]|nr:hypothetical protein [Gemmataceae bacterium]
MTTSSRFLRRDPADVPPWAETCGQIRCLIEEKDGAAGVREAPAEDLKQLQVLAGHLKEGQFVTKFRKTFAKDEMDDDLLLVPARLGKAEDNSEYEEILPTSPP